MCLVVGFRALTFWYHNICDRSVATPSIINIHQHQSSSTTIIKNLDDRNLHANEFNLRLKVWEKMQPGSYRGPAGVAHDMSASFSQDNANLGMLLYLIERI